MNKKIILSLIIAFTIVLFVACNNNKTDVNKQPIEEKQTSVTEVKGEIVLATRAPETFNPLLNKDPEVDQVLKLMFDPLVNINENIKPVPGIAQSWKLNDIGTEIELKLREDVNFHNGNKLTADDVIYSLDILKGASNTIYSNNVRNILSYKKIDDYTVRILYNKPSGDILYTLYFPIIPKNFDVNNPMGDGKYKLASYETMKQIKFDLNEKYYKKAGSIKSIIVKITSDENVDAEAFKQNQIDLIYSEKLNLQRYINDKNVSAYQYPTLYYDFLGFNYNKDIFKDKKIRQAVAYSLNKREMLDRYYLKLADIAETPIHPNSWLSAIPVKKYDYDSGKAAGLIKQAIGENKNKLAIRLLVNEENYQRLNMATAIKNELDKIGFTVTVDKSNMTDYMSKVQSGDFDLYLGGFRLAKYPDLTFMFNSNEYQVGKNYSGYKDAQMDLLLEKAFLSFNEEDMIKSYKDLQAYINEELPSVSLFFRQNAVYASAKFKGELKPLQWNIFNGIENCSVVAK